MINDSTIMTTKEKHHVLEEMPWDIIESYFDGQHLTRCIRHQLESYNHFVNHEIQKTIDMFNPVTVHSEHDYNKEHDKYTLEISAVLLTVVDPLLILVVPVVIFQESNSNGPAPVVGTSKLSVNLSLMIVYATPGS